jgi:hypothetical protein
MESSKPRIVLDRYPGVLTDWSGRFVDKRILSHVTVGNVVRVAFKDTLTNTVKNTAYLRIIKKCKKHENWFLGVVEDPYYGDTDWFPLKNGDQRAFSVYHITEIPFTWNGNKNLKKNGKFFNKARTILGTL